MNCAFVTSSDVGAVGCCTGDECGMRFTCVDFQEIMLSTACDFACLTDSLTLKCTDYLTPYCGTVSFFDGIMDYFCDERSASTIQQAYTTYSGQSDDRSFAEVPVTLTTSAGGSLDLGDITTSFDLSDISDVAGFTNTATGISTTPPQPSANSGGSSTNVGAIVGGVVGGVLGLALIGLLAFFLLRREKKNMASQEAQQQMASSTQQPPPHQGPTPPLNSHQPSYNGGYAPYPPQQGYQQPGYAQDPNKPGGFVTMAPHPPADRTSTTSPVSTGPELPDNRASMPQSSPTSTVSSAFPTGHPNQGQPHYQHGAQQPPPIPPTVYEASSNVVGQTDYNSNHRGQHYELG
jgi:hypothetical protein